MTASGLTKAYSELTAIDRLDLTIPAGQLLALLGPNGAGKSTVTEMILGLTSPDAGEVGVFGETPTRAVRGGTVGAMLQAAGVECRTPSAVVVPDDAASEVLGYVVREAVTNVVRHAGASVCTIEAGPDWVAVGDDGRGLSGRSAGQGLDGLAERLGRACGVLTIESSDAGTRVLATLAPDASGSAAGDAA